MAAHVHWNEEIKGAQHNSIQQHNTHHRPPITTPSTATHLNKHPNLLETKGHTHPGQQTAQQAQSEEKLNWSHHVSYTFLEMV